MDDSDFSYDDYDDDRLSDSDSGDDSRGSEDDMYSSGIDNFRNSGKKNNGYRKQKTNVLYEDKSASPKMMHNRMAHTHGQGFSNKSNN